MRTSGWMKKQPWFWPIKLFLKRVAGRELWLTPEVSLASQASGGWRYADGQLDRNSIVYSFGVGDSVDFDIDLIRTTGATIHAFDPTPFAREWIESQELPREFVFHPWAVAGENGSLRLYRRVNKRGASAEVMWTADRQAGDEEDFIDAPAYTVAAIMQKLQHDSVDLVKMDVEGAEFAVLDELRNVEPLPRQLLVEFHHRFAGIGKERTARCIRMLHGIGYRIFDVSETGREVGFVLREDKEP